MDNKKVWQVMDDAVDIMRNNMAFIRDDGVMEVVRRMEEVMKEMGE